MHTALLIYFNISIKIGKKVAIVLGELKSQACQSLEIIEYRENSVLFIMGLSIEADKKDKRIVI